MFETMIRLDDDLRAEIDRDCRRLRISRAQWLREAARDRLAGTVYRGALGQLLARVERLEQLVLGQLGALGALVEQLLSRVAKLEAERAA